MDMFDHQQAHLMACSDSFRGRLEEEADSVHCCAGMVARFANGLRVKYEDERKDQTDANGWKPESFQRLQVLIAYDTQFSNSANNVGPATIIPLVAVQRGGMIDNK